VKATGFAVAKKLQLLLSILLPSLLIVVTETQTQFIIIKKWQPEG